MSKQPLKHSKTFAIAVPTLLAFVGLASVLGSSHVPHEHKEAGYVLSFTKGMDDKEAQGFTKFQLKTSEDQDDDAAENSDGEDTLGNETNVHSADDGLLSTVHGQPTKEPALDFGLSDEEGDQYEEDMDEDYSVQTADEVMEQLLGSDDEFATSQGTSNVLLHSAIPDDVTGKDKEEAILYVQRLMASLGGVESQEESFANETSDSEEGEEGEELNVKQKKILQLQDDNFEDDVAAVFTQLDLEVFEKATGGDQQSDKTLTEQEQESTGVLSFRAGKSVKLKEIIAKLVAQNPKDRQAVSVVAAKVTDFDAQTNTFNKHTKYAPQEAQVELYKLYKKFTQLVLFSLERELKTEYHNNLVEHEKRTTEEVAMHDLLTQGLTDDSNNSDDQEAGTSDDEITGPKTSKSFAPVAFVRKLSMRKPQQSNLLRSISMTAIPSEVSNPLQPGTSANKQPPLRPALPPQKKKPAAKLTRSNSMVSLHKDAGKDAGKDAAAQAGDLKTIKKSGISGSFTNLLNKFTNSFRSSSRSSDQKGNKKSTPKEQAPTTRENKSIPRGLTGASSQTSLTDSRETGHSEIGTAQDKPMNETMLFKSAHNDNAKTTEVEPDQSLACKCPTKEEIDKRYQKKMEKHLRLNLSHPDQTVEDHIDELEQQITKMVTKAMDVVGNMVNFNLTTIANGIDLKNEIIGAYIDAAVQGYLAEPSCELRISNVDTPAEPQQLYKSLSQADIVQKAQQLLQAAETQCTFMGYTDEQLKRVLKSLLLILIIETTYDSEISLTYQDAQQKMCAIREAENQLREAENQLREAEAQAQAQLKSQDESAQSLLHAKRDVKIAKRNLVEIQCGKTQPQGFIVALLQQAVSTKRQLLVYLNRYLFECGARDILTDYTAELKELQAQKELESKQARAEVEPNIEKAKEDRKLPRSHPPKVQSGDTKGHSITEKFRKSFRRNGGKAENQPTAAAPNVPKAAAPNVPKTAAPNVPKTAAVPIKPVEIIQDQPYFLQLDG